MAKDRLTIDDVRDAVADHYDHGAGSYAYPFPMWHENALHEAFDWAGITHTLNAELGTDTPRGPQIALAPEDVAAAVRGIQQLGSYTWETVVAAAVQAINARREHGDDR